MTLIHHIVCFRFQDAATAAQIAAAGEALLTMPDGISGIRGIRWGPNLAPSVTEYSHVLTVMLDDMAAVSRYLEHPVHVRTVTQFLAPIRAARLAIDVEV